MLRLQRNASHALDTAAPGRGRGCALLAAGILLATRPLQAGTEDPGRKADLYVSLEDTQATVSLDGKVLPRTQGSVLSLEGIAAGRHRLVARARHRVDSLDVVLHEKEIRHVSLEPRTATVKVRFLSQPLGAQVFCDRQLLGTTPFLSRDLPEGPCRVTLHKDGHLDTTLAFDTDSTRRLSVHLVPSGFLAPEPGGPAELLLTRGDQALARTADERIELPAGTWRVRTVNPDWQAVDTAVVIEPGRTTRLPLARFWARLSVEVRQPALAWLDGKALGPVPHILESLAPGSHRLVLRSPGHHDQVRILALRPGEAMLVKLDLDSLEGRPGQVRAQGFEEE